MNRAQLFEVASIVVAGITPTTTRETQKILSDLLRLVADQLDAHSEPIRQPRSVAQPEMRVQLDVTPWWIGLQGGSIASPPVEVLHEARSRCVRFAEEEEANGTHPLVDYPLLKRSLWCNEFELPATIRCTEDIAELREFALHLRDRFDGIIVSCPSGVMLAAPVRS